MAALMALYSILEQSKSALLIVSSADAAGANRLPYTPFSIQLAELITELHQLLLNQIVGEKSNLLLTQLLKVQNPSKTTCVYR